MKFTFFWVKMSLMIYKASLDWTSAPGAVVVQGFLSSRPMFHLQLAEDPLDDCRMETWQDKKPNLHFFSPYPPQPKRALT